MNMLLLYTLNIVVIALENIMLAYLASGFFTRKVSRPIFLLSVLGIFIVMPLGYAFTESIPFANLVIFILLSTIWMQLIFRPGIIKSLFVSIFLDSFFYAVDSIVIYTILSAAKDGAAIMNDPYSYYTLCFAAKAVELFGVVLFRTWVVRRRDRYASNWLDWLRVLFYPLITLIIAILLARLLSVLPEQSSLLLICLTILLSSDFLSVFLLDYIEQQRMAKQDNVILKQSLQMASDQVRSLEESYSQQRKLTHDFKNQLAVIKGMIGTETSYDDVAEYLDQITAETAPAGNYVDTNRLIANLLINQKMEEAKRRHIHMRAELDDLSQFPLSDEALVVVLSNLLDNALEACEKIEDESRRQLLLTMQMKEQSSYLCVENTTAGAVRIVNNTIRTTKGASMEHGYGLRNACAALEQAGAIYSLHYDEETSTFCFSAEIKRD